MRVLVVSNLYPPYHHGGYGAWCYRICEGLADRGHDVLVLSSLPRNPESPDTRDMQPRTAVWRSLRMIETRHPLRLWRTMVHNHGVIRRAIRRCAPDLVYTFGMDGLGFDVFQTVTCSGLPVVAALGDTWLGQAWRNLSKFDPWTALASDRRLRFVTLPKMVVAHLGRLGGVHFGSMPSVRVPVHAVSSFVRDHLRASGGLLEERHLVCPPPLSTHFFTDSNAPVGNLAPPPPPFRALFVSRMERLKGPDTAITAVSHAIRAGVDIRLTLCGFGMDAISPELTLLAQHLGVQEFIHWRSSPTTSDLIKLYRSHHVLLFPSRIVEGFGIVCAEAMACGLPVLGTAPGGQTDIILDGESGLLHDPGDDLALGHQLVQLASQPQLVQKLSAGALNVVLKCHPNTVLDSLETFLLKQLTSRSG